MEQACPECGSENVRQETVKDQLRYGRDGEMFEAIYPINHCNDCKLGWIDHLGQDEITLAQFRYEKSKGVVRTKFVGDEKRLWEQA
jgi:hypothetical protein